MSRAGMRTSLFQAVMNGVLERIVHVFAGVNAGIHFWCLVFVNVEHGLVVSICFGLWFFPVAVVVRRAGSRMKGS